MMYIHSANLHVLVMAGDPDLRRRRLVLLKRLERLVLQLADVSALVK